MLQRASEIRILTMMTLIKSSHSHSSCGSLAVAGVALCLGMAVPRIVAQASPTTAQSAPQNQQAPAENAPDVTLHTNVDEVSLDMVVHDKGKKLILDLKPEDLQVTDEGTPVKLTGLHLVHGDST